MGVDLLFRYSNYVSLITLCPIAFGSVLTFGYFLGAQRSCFHSPFSLWSPSAFWIHDKLYGLGFCRLHALAVALACTQLSRILQDPVTSGPRFKGKTRGQLWLKLHLKKAFTKPHIKYKQLLAFFFFNF